MSPRRSLAGETADIACGLSVAEYKIMLTFPLKAGYAIPFTLPSAYQPTNLLVRKGEGKRVNKQARHPTLSLYCHSFLSCATDTAYLSVYGLSTPIDRNGPKGVGREVGQTGKAGRDGTRVRTGLTSPSLPLCCLA